MEGNRQNDVVLLANSYPMNYSSLLIPVVLLISFSCVGPSTEESSLFGSLEKLPSVSVVDASTFSLGSQKILVRGKQQEITLESIQLLSGFKAAIQTGLESSCLENPTSFIKYPFAAKQLYKLDNQGLEVNQLQIISKDKLGITVLFAIKNVDNFSKSIQFQFQPSIDLKPSVLQDSNFGSNARDQISYDEVTKIFTAKDTANEWYAVWGTSTDFSITPHDSDCLIDVSPFGATAGFEISVELEANDEKVIPVFIAGSDQGEFSAIETLIDLRAGIYSDWDENFELIDSLRSTSKLTIPDAEIQEAYEWSKYKFGLFELGKDSIHGKEIGAGWEYQMLDDYRMHYIETLDEDVFLSQNDTVKADYSAVQSLLMDLLGLEPDIENRVTYIRPNLPKEWNEASIEKLWIDDNKINITITANAGHLIVEVIQTQKKAGLSIELPEEYSKVKVLGKEVSTDTKEGFRRILMTGDHVRIEANKD